MKTCINCGHELKDEAFFCGRCGTPQPAQAETETAAAPEAVPRPEPKPRVDQWGGVVTEEPPAPETPVKKPRRVWPVILAAVLVAALAAGGVFFVRTTQQFREIRYRDENDQLAVLESYDTDGRILSETMYDGDTVTFEQSYRETKAAKELPDADLLEIEGVTEVHAAQLYRGGVESHVFVIGGYDRRGRLLGAHVYEFDAEGKLLYEYTSEYTRDALGHMTHWEQHTADGTLMLSVDADNTTGFGKLVSSELRYTRYGSFLQTDTGYVYQQLNVPEQFSRTAEYQY